MRIYFLIFQITGFLYSFMTFMTKKIQNSPNLCYLNYEILSKTNAQNKSAYTEKRTLKKWFLGTQIKMEMSFSCFHRLYKWIKQLDDRRLISITVYYVITFMWSTSHQSVSSLPFNTITNCSIAVLENNVFKDFFQYIPILNFQPLRRPQY